MNAIQICNILLAVNCLLLFLSFLFLWLPINFKIFGWVWFIYTLRVFVPMCLKPLSKKPFFTMAILMAGVSIESLIRYKPECHIQWDNIPKHYRNLLRRFLIYSAIIIIIQYKFYVSGI